MPYEGGTTVMSRMPTAIRRSILIGAAASLAATTIAGVAPAQTTSGAKDTQLAASPMLRLHSAVSRVSVEQGRHDRVRLDLGVYAIAGDEGFRIDAHRTSWWKPITAEIVSPSGNVALPEGSITSFRKIKNFVNVTFTKRSTGETVSSRGFGFCPTNDQVRSVPEAPNPTRPYPTFCPYSPFTRGAVYGISPQYATRIFDEYGSRMQLPLGHYTATVSIAEPYAGLMSLSPTDATTTVDVDVVKDDGDGCRAESSLHGCKADGSTSKTGSAPSKAVGGSVPRNPVRPTTTSEAAPTAAVYPDLQSLPATSIELHRHYVSFAATVWNAGPSPLVVDGFRRADEDVMDAVQYYYDENGNELGHDPAGSMEWDARHGHTHWHFRDFARYRLLDADKDHVVRSRKEAFCLANTDAVDYSLPGANWNPYNTDLHTSCGTYTSMAVREVLDAGNGDTYYQGLPGQSFNVENLPNGTYYIAVEANPFGVIHETATNNNNSYRKFYLRGSGDNRYVVVPQKGIITENNGGCCF